MTSTQRADRSKANACIYGDDFYRLRRGKLPGEKRRAGEDLELRVVYRRLPSVLLEEKPERKPGGPVRRTPAHHPAEITRCACTQTFPVHSWPAAALNRFSEAFSGRFAGAAAAPRPPALARSSDEARAGDCAHGARTRALFPLLIGHMRHPRTLPLLRLLPRPKLPRLCLSSSPNAAADSRAEGGGGGGAACHPLETEIPGRFTAKRCGGLSGRDLNLRMSLSQRF